MGQLYLCLLRLTGGRLKRQAIPLFVLSALIVLLPLLAGQGATQVLSDGVSFSGIVLAVTAPEGKRVPNQIVRTVGSMTDVRQYCRMEAMEEAEASRALAEGRVTAILALPEQFVRSVQWGENPAVQLIVDGQHPTEALLTLWVGQSAADLLSAAQAGIYGVLDCYEANPASLSREEVVLGINLKYMQWTANRQAVFETRTCLPTGELPIALHYGLSWLGALLLSLVPLFCWNFQGTWLSYHRRLRLAGRSALVGFWSSLTVCAASVLPLTTIGLATVGGLPPLSALGVGILWAMLFAVWVAACGLATKSAAGCGCLSLGLTAGFLLVSGGLVPPVLLPEGLRQWAGCSPVTWMRDWAATALGSPATHPVLPLAMIGVVCLLTAAGYVRRAARGEGI